MKWQYPDPAPHDARRRRLALAAAAACLAAAPAWAASSAAQLSKDAQAALQKLSSQVPAAKALAKDAKAVLVFPKVTKAGLGVQGNKITKINPK